MSVGTSISKWRLTYVFSMLLHRIFRDGGFWPSANSYLSLEQSTKTTWTISVWQKMDWTWWCVGSIGRGWSESTVENSENFVSKIINCRHEIATWRKNNPLYEKEKTSELQRALEEVQTDNSITQQDILEVSRKLQETYKDDEDFWQQKSRNM